MTRLAVQKKDPRRVSVYLDGEFRFGLHRDVLLEHRVAKGKPLTVEEQEALRAADARYRAYDRAVRYLGYRPRTAEEVRRKLRGAGYAESVVEETVDRLLDARYLDDRSYARSYAEGRMANRGYGPRRIRMELRRRGVADRTIDSVMETFEEDVNTQAVARAQAGKRWAQLAREKDLRKRRKKLFDYLVRRGFDYDTVRLVVEEVSGA